MRIRRAIAVAAGVVAAAAGTACGADASATSSRTIELTIRHSRFVPSTFEVERGERVRIVIRNDDPIDHELIVGEQDLQDFHEMGTASHHGGDVQGEVSVAAGEQAVTTYTFTGDNEVLYGCHLPGHWGYGMRGAVIVR